MDQSLRQQLVHPKENIYFALVILFSILTYVLLAVSIIGIAIIVVLLLLSVFLQGLMMAGIRRNAVKLSEEQFPRLYELAAQTAADMELKSVPDIYVMESEGVLNAFATRFFRRNMVVLYSSIFEMAERGAEKEVLFVMAHEFAHLKRNHVLVNTLILPAMWVPFLGTAYSRACEYTCDRYAAYYVQSYEAAKDALTMLAIGSSLYPKVNKEAYMKQLETESGFFVWLNEKLSTHPHLPKRLYALSRFFSSEMTPVLKESKGKVVIGVIISFFVFILLSVAVWFSISQLEKLDLFSDSLYEEDYSFTGEEIPVEGVTPLMDAAFNNDTASILTLIEEGEDIDAVDSEDTSVLHWAVYGDNLEAAEVLLQAGANPDTVDYTDSTPLITAAANGNAELTEQLLNYGADSAYIDASGSTAYDYAMEYGYNDVAALLAND
ncbi:M48 family metallopeptidase [Cytobacillus gottheilii]|uniref:M48 family metalloprotease n=1 Tax=Cytobacillus gottheilii TaxID=859144 RepID=A0ABX8F9B0_9BACI|nr:M48 family metallopeptidase [Cytobacillus gottheilii]QVY60739.1 M48 family metalloprotease [Cytobacillus gottheilii]